MGHIFISYSHKDTNYAHGLANNLQGMGFDVWIDARVDYGSQWPYEIQKQLDGCDAFILIMTPRSFSSDWVQNELQRAKRKLKPIFPLLLEGDEPWLSVESTQYYDVRGGNFPDIRFYSAIRKTVSVSQKDTTLHFAKSIAKSSSSGSVKPKMSTEVFIAIIGAVVTIVTACATIIGGPLIQKWLSSPSIPDPLVSVTATGESLSSFDPSVVAPSADVPSVVPDSTNDSMVLVPEGQFIMGSDGGDSDEQPVHEVYLDDFYIDKYEVTNAFYKACVDADMCDPPKDTSSFTHSNYYGNSEFDNHPVIFVDWNQANSFCEWRGAQLPTEAQWEKAARGTDGGIYPWEEEISCDKANYSGCVGDVTAIGSYEDGKSPYGVYDMAGNVWEWVADRYSDTYYQNSLSSNPLGPDSGQYRIVRGGSWYVDESFMRTSFRLRDEPVVIYNDFGFRCARDANP